MNKLVYAGFILQANTATLVEYETVHSGEGMPMM
jgi:hypothetical protein